MERPKGAWQAGLLLAVVLCCLCAIPAPASAQSDAGINVCPDARWSKLPFLKAHTSPATILTLVDAATSGGDIKTAGVGYAKTNLVPKIGANVLFFVLAVLFFLIFLLWRFTRWCCNVLCCSSSCDSRRAKNDPYDLLFTGRMTAHKLAMFMFAVAAIICYIYGMAGTSKTVVVEAFKTVDSLDTYLQGPVGHIDDLVSAVGGISSIIDDLQTLVNDKINVAGMEANMTTFKNFLSTASPGTLASTLTALNTHVNTDLPAALAALTTSLTAVSPTSPLATAITTMVAAPTAIAAMTTALSGLDSKIAALPPTGSGTPSTTTPPVSDFSNAVLAIALGITGTWATTLDGLSAAIDTLGALQGAANPLTIVNSRMGAVIALTTQITGSEITSLSADITTIAGQYNTVDPALAGLIAQLQSINTTVLELTAPMLAAYNSINDARTALAAFFGATPSPAALAAQLVTDSASLTPPGTVTAILSGLSTQATTLNGAQFNPTPVGSDGAVLKAFVIAAKSDIAAVQTGTWASMASARATYFATQTGANYDALKTAADAYRASAATTTMRNKLAEQASAPCAASDYAAAAPAIGAAASAAYTSFPAVVTATSNAISALPSLTSYSTAINQVTLPPLTVFDAPQAALDSIQAAVITGGNNAKSSITSTLTSFNGATSMLQDKVLSKLDMVQVKIKPPALKYDSIRYEASMALYALPILLLLVLLFCALLVNFHFGTNIMVLFVLVLLILGFILAVVIALILALLSDACPAVEPILLSKVPSNMLPLANYYFGTAGGSAGVSVKAVLKSAGIVDVDAVLGQVTSGQAEVISGITSTYTFRAEPTLILQRINTTVDNAVGSVGLLLDSLSYDQVFPLYSGIKGMLCCTIPDSFSSMWTAFSIGGMLAWFLILLTFFYIGKLDRLPRTDCCGCTCHTRSRYSATIMPPGPLRMVGFGAWGGRGRGLGPITGSPAARPKAGEVAIPMPRGGSWEDGQVVAQVVVRPPGAFSPAGLE